MIDTFVPCINCEYDLRGLAESGVCPECGTPIKISADLDIPGPVSSITWVRRGLLLTGIQLCLVHIHSTVALVYARSGMFGVHVALLLILLVKCSFCIFGSWWLTIPCNRSASNKRSGMRFAVRAFAFVTIILELFTRVIYYIGGFSPGVGLNLDIVVVAVQAFWIGSFGLYLGTSISDMDLAFRVRRATGLLFSLYLLLSVVSVYDVIWPSSGPTPSWIIIARGLFGIGGILSVLLVAREMLATRTWYSRILVKIERRRQQNQVGQVVDPSSQSGV